MTYDEARRNADTALSLIAPRGGLAAARPPAPSAPPPRPTVVEEGGPRSLANGGTRGPAGADPNAVAGEGGTGTTGPPPDQSSLPQNGAPSGAVSAFGEGQVVRLSDSRLAARPPKRGRPPIGDDGYPVELHHEGQVPDGRVLEMTRNDHRLGENYRINHPNTGQSRSLIDRVRFARQRYRHWAEQWDAGRFDNLPERSKAQVEELQRAAAMARMQSRQQRLNE